MFDEELVERLRVAIDRREQRPAKELFEEKVQRGVIDKDGKVLKRPPQAPRKRRSKKSEPPAT